MRIGSLFAGYGGLDLGLSMIIDAEPVWFVEFDKHPSAVLARRYPDVPNHGDVTSVDWAAVEPVDILTGGFPCQDVSHAGLRRGIKPGTRSGLWEHFAYAIKALRPGLVVIENVSGILSADAHCDVEPCPWCVGDEPAGHMRALGAVLADLAEAGFDAEWCSVRAADAGAPHGRLRVFIVATDATRGQLAGAAVGADRLLVAGERGSEPDGLTLLPTPAVNDMGRGKTVEDWDAWTATMQAKHGNGKSLEIEAQRLLPTPTARDWKDGATNPDAVPVNGLLGRAVWHLEEGDSDAAEHQADTGAVLPGLRDEDGTETVQRSAGGHDTVHVAADMRPVVRQHQDGSDQGRAALASEEAPQAELRTVPDDPRSARPSHRPEPGEQRPGQPDDAVLVVPSETALAGGSGAPHGGRSEGYCDGCRPWGPYAAAIHRWEIRLGRLAPAPTEPGMDGRHRLSPRAVEFMMGLPDGWVTGVGVPRSAQLKALGNGVVPQQAALALAMLDGDGAAVYAAPERLLPTPKASDGPNGGPGMRNGRGVPDALPGVVAQLLPTATAQAKHAGDDTAIQRVRSACNRIIENAQRFDLDDEHGLVYGQWMTAKSILRALDGDA